LAIEALGSRALPESPARSWVEALLGRGSIALARTGMPAILLVGVVLSWILPRVKAGAWLRVTFSRGGRGWQVLLSAWVAVAAAIEELADRPPYLLIVGLAALAIFAWRRPRLLLASADPERLAPILGAAVLCVAIGSTIRHAVLSSADRLNTLQRENEQLWELSFRDALTGLFNRRYSQEVGAMLFARAKRYGEQLHVLMLDIDRFKLVNDKLGHPVGDEVLKAVAAILANQVRTSDVATRYGGEEFLVFLIQTEPEVVQFIANRIRDAVSAYPFPGVPWQLTISIGVAGIKADDTLTSLVDRADKYLYASKRGGRNRVTGF
jgi:diguanylate cyclase (GGDEF)-like protein